MGTAAEQGQEEEENHEEHRRRDEAGHLRPPVEPHLPVGPDCRTDPDSEVEPDGGEASLSEEDRNDDEAEAGETVVPASTEGDEPDAEADQRQPEECDENGEYARRPMTAMGRGVRLGRVRHVDSPSGLGRMALGTGGGLAQVPTPRQAIAVGSFG